MTTQTTTLLNQDDASFTMTPSCDGATAVIQGAAGGAFSFNPAPADGAIMDPTTGAITNGTPGATYTIEYTTQSDCSAMTTQTVTLLNQDDASFGMIPSCDGGTAVITGVIGGVFSLNPLPTDGAVIDPITGTITNGLTGTIYTVEYTLSLIHI